MRPPPLGPISLLLLALLACGRSESSSEVSSTYGKLQWLDTDQVISRYSENVQHMVSSAVVLSKQPTAFRENGFCSGGLIEYKGEQMIVTAGHCIDTQKKCDETFISPEFEFKNGDYKSNYVVLKCNKLLARAKQGKQVDIAVTSFIAVKGTLALAGIKPFPIRIRHVKGGERLMGAGHPSNLDDELVEEILEKDSINWGELMYLNSGYTYAKKTVYDCMTFVTSMPYFTHDCDTRKGFSGAPLYIYPDLAFAGIHFRGGKYFATGARINPDELNRGTSASQSRMYLDQAVDRLRNLRLTGQSL